MQSGTQRKASSSIQLFAIKLKIERKAIHTISFRLLSFIPNRNTFFTVAILLSELAVFFYILYQPLFSTAYAQFSLESSPSMTPQTETVTSYHDALLKVPLIISQTAIVGVVLCHIIIRKVIQNKIISNYGGKTDSTTQSQDTKYLYPLKRFFLILLSCGITMIISATSLFLLQAFNLSLELGLDVTTTFTILSSTPIGPVWNLRVVTSLVIIVSSSLYYILERKSIIKDDANSVNYNNSVPQRETRGISVFRSILLCIVIISGAISIFSNSVVSHNTASVLLSLARYFYGLASFYGSINMAWRIILYFNNTTDDNKDDNN